MEIPQVRVTVCVHVTTGIVSCNPKRGVGIPFSYVCANKCQQINYPTDVTTRRLFTDERTNDYADLIAKIRAKTITIMSE